MGYKVLARKYRPLFFSEVVGQDIFVNLMRNALAGGKLGHALLLTGIRGIGKTTLARLIAKAISCPHRNAQQEPCGTCSSCQSVQEDRHLDILEIDAASHTGVDDVRHILESCQYKPLAGPFKIFIIDEVHMLSKSAFNALLKTLEEPPAHVKFILATTELGKVPATVISRCQHLALRRFSVEALFSYLRFVCEKEEIRTENGALELIASYGQGSARDGLTLLERAILSLEKDHPLTKAMVQKLLGLPQEKELNDLMNSLLKKDGKKVLQLAQNFYEAGLEPHQILAELCRAFHKMSVEKMQKGESFQDLDRLFHLAQQGIAQISCAPFVWPAMEMLLLRMIYIHHFPTPGDILKAIPGEKFSQALKEPFSKLQGTPLQSTKGSYSKEESLKKIDHSISDLKEEESSTPSASFSQDLMPIKKPFPFPSTPKSGEQKNAPFLDPKKQYTLEGLMAHLEGLREPLLLATVSQCVSWISIDLQLAQVHLGWPRDMARPPHIEKALNKIFSQWLEKESKVIWHPSEEGETWSEKQEKIQKELKEKTRTHGMIKVLDEVLGPVILEHVEQM